MRSFVIKQAEIKTQVNSYITGNKDKDWKTESQIQKFEGS